MCHLSSRPLLVVLTLAIVATFAHAQPPPQTHRWRIGVTGGYCTGYLGLLALHGLPRERIDDDDVLNLEKMKAYDLLIIGSRGYNNAQAIKVLEQYVYEGGIALTESLPIPSTDAIPGRRIGPAPAPNLRFVDSGTPLTTGCPELGVIPCAGLSGASIIPEANSKVTVLARYTDEDAPKRFQGTFVADGQGTPAIVMAEYGKGKLVYCGAAMSYAISLRGRQFEPFLINLLRYVSNGELADRMFPANVERTDLLTATEPQEPQRVYVRPAGTPAPPPTGFEKLEEPDSLRDFAFTTPLQPGTEGRLLLSYWSPKSFRELTVSKGKVTLVRSYDGRSVTLGSGVLPAGAKELLVMRRHGLVTVKADMALVFSACDGPAVQGALAAKGFHEPSYQPLDSVRFSDDFMREAAASDDWEQVTGKWQIMAAEGKPDMGANPFDFQVTTPDKALAVTGNWFWSDYAYEAAVKPSGEAVGIIADYQDGDNCLLLRLQPGTPGKLQLLRKHKGQFKVLGETTAPLSKQDWSRLGLRTSHGVIEALLDRRVVLRSYQADQPLGQIGLYCEKGQGNFDDVRVWPWVAAGGGTPQSRDLLVLQGQWRNTADTLVASGVDGARALIPWNAEGDCQASVAVNLGQAAAAGLHLRYVDPQKYYLLALIGEGDKLKIRCYRHGNPGAVLAERPVPGPRNAWHKLSALVQDTRLVAYVDDKPLLNVLDAGHLSGQVGLYARGKAGAAFRDFSARQCDNDAHLVDELTPAFAGIIDRHTWAGRSGAWVPNPSSLNDFWHTGYFPGTVQLQVGLHPDQQPQAKTVVHLSAGKQKNGYALVTERTWAQDSVPVVLTRSGRKIAEGKAKVEPGKPYSVGLYRNGAQLMVQVNGKPTLGYTDPQPLPNLDSLGIDSGGTPLYADDLTVLSPQVYDYTFETAPTDWAVQSGTWEITSRWSCTPGWAWFSGYNSDGYATISTKHAYQGDMQVTLYVAAKMMPAGNGKFSEKLTDIYLGLMGQLGKPETGYQFVLGGMNNQWTALRRNGVQVASSNFRLSQAGMHNDWLQVTLVRRGNKLQCYAWSTLVLEYTDPQPLEQGVFSIGTYQNGILVPRVTIFGTQEQ